MDVQKVYCRTAKQVVEEFKAIEALGITDVQIYDDTFTWSKKADLANWRITSLWSSPSTMEAEKRRTLSVSC